MTASAEARQELHTPERAGRVRIIAAAQIQRWKSVKPVRFVDRPTAPRPGPVRLMHAMIAVTKSRLDSESTKTGVTAEMKQAVL